MVMPLILASASPRRRTLLRANRIPFTVILPHVSERSPGNIPSAMVKELALRKARYVARKLEQGIVLGADTIVVVQGRKIGKPKNLKDALRILAIINGRINVVYTGIALVDAKTGKKMVDYEKSSVYMKKLPLKKLAHLALKHLDKAGAYAVQEKKDMFVTNVVGDYTNVVGLPIPLLKEMLKKFSLLCGYCTENFFRK